MSIIKYRDNESSPWQTIDVMKGRDAIHVGPSAPTDPEIDMWLDTDEPGQTVVTSVNGMSGAVTIPTADEGTGYCKMPDGTLIQWGEEQNKSNQAQITFVEAYESHPTVFLTPVYNYQRTVRCSLGAVATTTGFTMYAYDTDTNGWSTSTDLRFYWVAVGRWK